MKRIIPMYYETLSHFIDQFGVKFFESRDYLVYIQSLAQHLAHKMCFQKHCFIVNNGIPFKLV